LTDDYKQNDYSLHRLLAKIFSTICRLHSMKYRLCVFILFVSHMLSAQQWEEQAVVPSIGRDDAVAFSINGYGYLVTGNQGGFSESNRLWKFDPSAGSWSEAAAFPGTPRQYAAAFVLAGEAYLFCGISEASVPLHDVWKYTPATDSWTQLNDFPGAARWSLFAADMNGYGFIGTGTTLTTLLNDAWMYDPQNDNWLPIAAFPGGARRETVAFTAGGKLYAGLGYVNINGTGLQSSFYSYSLQGDVWQPVADFPGGARSYAVGISAGDLGYVGTGYDTAAAFLKDVYSFDPQNSSWSAVNEIPVEGIRGMSAFVINSEPYFLTGLISGFGRTSQMWKLKSDPVLTADVFCYPNPSTGTVAIRSLPDSGIRLYTLQGKITHELRSVELYTTIENLLAGTYLIRVEKSGSVSCEMLIVY